MAYEINISLNGKHFFATDKRSITTSDDVAKVLPELVKRFPTKEGFAIDLSYNPERSFGTRINSVTDLSVVAVQLFTKAHN